MIFHDVNRILIVCQANTCRSPIAALLLKKNLPDKAVLSAGIHVPKPSKMQKHSLKLVSQHNIDGSQHVSRQLTTEICRQCDVILVMETSHINAVLNIDPSTEEKIFLIGKWTADLEIPDPYQQGFKMYKHIFDLIQKSVNIWVKYLK